MEIKRLSNEYKILKKYSKDISTYGAGSTSNKNIYLDSHISKNSMNNYTMTVTLRAKNSYTWNGYGIRVYCHIGGSKELMGTPTITNGVCSQSTFTKTFSIGSNTECYATAICVHCESGPSSDVDLWSNRTSTDIAYYESPSTPPSNAVCNLNKSGTIEGTVTATASYTCTHPSGTTNYQFRYRINNGSWTTSGWQSSNSYNLDITSLQRGALFEIATNVRNGVGESGWSSGKTIRSNSLPSKPVNLAVNNTRPTGTVTLSWNASSDADSHSISYDVFLSKNGGGQIHLGSTTSTSISYDTSSDSQGTSYQFKVEAKDALGAKNMSDFSSTFHKATQPSSQAVSLNKSGTIEGTVTATASYSCSYPTGTTEYQFAYYYDGIAWQEQGWSTNNTFSINTSIKRGVDWGFKVRIRNGAGTSEWSLQKTVKSNSAPTAPTGLTYSPKFPVPEIIFGWNNSTDPDGHAITYSVLLSKNGGAYVSVASSLSANTYKHDISNDSEGTIYKFKVEAKDSFNVTATSIESEEFFKPITPSVPSFVFPAAEIKEDNFEVKWSLSNFHSLKGHYVVEKKINSGSWVSAIANLTLTSFVFDITSINRGDSVQFRVKAVNEAGQSSAWTTSNSVKRNRLPSAATNIKPTDTYLLNVITFQWDASIDPDGHAINYELYISKNEGNYIHIGSTTNTSFKWAIPGNDAGETSYRLKIESIDSLGGIVATVGPLIKKPTPPTAPTGLGPASGYYEGHIDLTWTASNFYNQVGSYDLEIYVDGVLNKTVNVSSNTYRYSLAGIPRGSKISYKVKARNVFNQESKWTLSSSNMYHNRIPEAPSFVIPVNNGELCSRNPKIIIRTNVEYDNQTMTVYVKYGAATYNSLSHPQYFSKTSVGNNQYIVFKHTGLLDIGTNTIEAYVSDGLINSPKVLLTLKIFNNISNVSAGSFVTADQYNERVNMINKSRGAYGLLPYDIHNATNNSLVFASFISNAIKSIKELTDKIDSYHENNKFKYEFIYDSPVSDTTYISNNHYNQLSNALNNL